MMALNKNQKIKRWEKSPNHFGLRPTHKNQECLFKNVFKLKMYQNNIYLFLF
jgi:hypothetical protein